MGRWCWRNAADLAATSAESVLQLAAARRTTNKYAKCPTRVLLPGSAFPLIKKCLCRTPNILPLYVWTLLSTEQRCGVSHFFSALLLQHSTSHMWYFAHRSWSTLSLWHLSSVVLFGTVNTTMTCRVYSFLFLEDEMRGETKDNPTDTCGHNFSHVLRPSHSLFHTYPPPPSFPLFAVHLQPWHFNNFIITVEYAC